MNPESNRQPNNYKPAVIDRIMCTWSAFTNWIYSLFAPSPEAHPVISTSTDSIPESNLYKDASSLIEETLEHENSSNIVIDNEEYYRVRTFSSEFGKNINQQIPSKDIHKHLSDPNLGMETTNLIELNSDKKKSIHKNIEMTLEPSITKLESVASCSLAEGEIQSTRDDNFKEKVVGIIMNERVNVDESTVNKIEEPEVNANKEEIELASSEDKNVIDLTTSGIKEELELNISGNEGEMKLENKEQMKLEPKKDIKALEVEINEDAKATELEPKKDIKTLEVEINEDMKATELEPKKDTKALEIETNEDVKTTELETNKDIKTLEVKINEDAKATELETKKDIKALEVEINEDAKATELETKKDIKALAVEVNEDIIKTVESEDIKPIESIPIAIKESDEIGLEADVLKTPPLKEVEIVVAKSPLEDMGTLTMQEFVIHLDSESSDPKILVQNEKKITSFSDKKLQSNRNENDDKPRMVGMIDMTNKEVSKFEKEDNEEDDIPVSVADLKKKLFSGGSSNNENKSRMPRKGPNLGSKSFSTKIKPPIFLKEKLQDNEQSSQAQGDKQMKPADEKSDKGTTESKPKADIKRATSSVAALKSKLGPGFNPLSLRGGLPPSLIRMKSARSAGTTVKDEKTEKEDDAVEDDAGEPVILSSITRSRSRGASCRRKPSVNFLQGKGKVNNIKFESTTSKTSSTVEDTKPPTDIDIPKIVESIDDQPNDPSKKKRDT